MRPWCEGYTDCRLPVQTQASQGHSCDLHTDVDYSGHDMIFGHGGRDAAKARPYTSHFLSSDDTASPVPAHLHAGHNTGGQGPRAKAWCLCIHAKAKASLALPFSST